MIDLILKILYAHPNVSECEECGWVSEEVYDYGRTTEDSEVLCQECAETIAHKEEDTYWKHCYDMVDEEKDCNR